MQYLKEIIPKIRRTTTENVLFRDRKPYWYMFRKWSYGNTTTLVQYLKKIIPNIRRTIALFRGLDFLLFHHVFGRKH